MQLNTSLYEHQIKAVDKLSNVKVGALYMEMGTGKTRTALELIKKRLDEGKVNHVLWLCPCSVKESLKRDIKKHASGDLSMFTICGIETLSSSIRANIALLELVEQKSVYLIVDESNLVKNHKAKRTQNIIRLSESCKYKLILNGTPISKCEKDLFAQWYILDWRILGYRSFWSFAANHLEYDERVKGKIVRCLNVDYLVRKIAPYTYQVKKSECLDLPDKTYSNYYYSMTKEQLEHYDYVAEQLLFEVDELEPHTIYRLFSGLESVISGFRVKVGDKLTRKPLFKNPMDNPRMQTLFEILDNLDEKVIIFCKYTKEILDIVEIANNRYGEGSAVAFCGELNQKKRQVNILEFKDSAKFFVANKICAGYGLDLQFCSYVIYYSNDWDYATRGQSEDRVHRIGQDKNVHIVDICASNTLDERIIKCLNRKEDLVASFKKELDRQKDNNFVDAFIYRRSYDGVKYAKKSEIKEIDDLKEGV